MVSAIISRIIILVFGTLYPAYASYKAVKNKNVREYVKWMMYWIVFALFTCAETFSDTFLSWVPFYYEIKIIFVLWMLSPATKGSSILYRKFVHPQLMKREEKIDAYIAQASDKGYTALLRMGSKGLNYATNVVLKTAVRGQAVVVDQLKKSYSMNDISVTGERMSLQTRGDTDLGTDDIDNRVLEDRDRTNEMLRRNPTYQYQRQSYHEEGSVAAGSTDMYDLDERDEEVEIIEEEFQPQPERPPQSRRTTRSYKHDEAYHYATLPRSTRRTRRSVHGTAWS